MNILVLNCGSSSVKFQLIVTDLEQITKKTDKRLARGVIERIGGEAIITLEVEGKEKKRVTAALKDIRATVDYIVRWAASENSGVDEIQSIADIHAVGHRVVHGGEQFTHSILISDEVMRGLEDMIELAPLHNPANIKGIQAARDIFGAGLPQVAGFCTPFHPNISQQP